MRKFLNFKGFLTDDDILALRDMKSLSHAHLCPLSDVVFERYNGDVTGAVFYAENRPMYGDLEDRVRAGWILNESLTIDMVTAIIK